MQDKFNVVLNSIHPTSIMLPEIGNVEMIAGRDMQLLNASIDTVNYLRNTFTGTGVKVTLNKKSDKPFLTHDYSVLSNPSKPINNVPKEKPQKTSLQTLSEFSLPSGKYKGKKLKDVKDDSLKQIALVTKNQAVKSAVEAYLMLK